MKRLIITTLVMAFSVSLINAQENIATYRGEIQLNQEDSPPVMPKVLNKDIKRKRNYPMQPPTIPHKVDNYQGQS